LSLTTSNKGKYQQPMKDLLPCFKFVNYGDTKDLEEKINDSIAGIILEPIQGEGGIIIPPKNYLSKVRQLCDKHNILLIFDEVQSGIGRTGKFLACDHEGVVPDILCLSKGLGGGFPIGATILTKAISGKIPKGTHTSTFGGNPFACSACLAVLNFIEKNKLTDHVTETSDYFVKKLKMLNSKIIREIRGKGLMIGVVLKRNATPYLIKLQKAGIIAAPSVPNTIRLLPPLIITKTEIDQAISILKKILI